MSITNRPLIERLFCNVLASSLYQALYVVSMMISHICEFLVQKEVGRLTNMRELRLAAGLRQIDVAKKMNVDQGAVSKWESGETRPSRKYHKKLAKLYGVKVEELPLGMVPGPVEKEESKNAR